MPKIFIVILLFLFSTAISSCVSSRQPAEFTTVYARRFIPKQFVSLGYRVYQGDNNREKLRCVGAVSGVDKTGRWGLVWAEYAQDARGDWYRQSHKDQPFDYAFDLAEAQQKADDHLRLLPIK